MNVFTGVILAALLVAFGLDVLSNILNLRAPGRGIPPVFRDVFDEGAYRASEAYTRAKTRLGMLDSGTGLAAVILFWFLGGFNRLDLLVRSWGLSPVLTGVMYIGILLLLRWIVHLPFEIYETFVTEQRFGFNRTTAKTFIADRIKGFLLAVALGGPFIGGILAFFMDAGNFAWMYVWIAVSAVSVLLQFVIPVWIMPIFNKFQPLGEGELRRAIMDYAASAGFPIRDVYIIDSSKRSTKTNAFFTGFGRNKRIALFDTLVREHSAPEIVAVIAHEVGHYKRKHILQGMVIGAVHTGILLFLLSLFVRSEGLAAAFFMEHVSVYAGFVFFALLYIPVDLLLSILMNALSRHNEYEADRFAAETTGTPENLVSTLKKLSRHNLSDLTPHPFHVFLHYSHPPVSDRIRAMRGKSGGTPV